MKLRKTNRKKAELSVRIELLLCFLFGAIQAKPVDKSIASVKYMMLMIEAQLSTNPTRTYGNNQQRKENAVSHFVRRIKTVANIKSCQVN